MSHLPRFLFLLYHYPPLPGIAPKRNDQISTELSKRSAYSLVFTASKQEHERISPASPVIQQIRTVDYRNIVKRKTVGGSIKDHKKSSAWFQRAIKLLNTFPFSILIAEGGLIYIINIIRLGHKAIKKNNITHLYSSFRPFADHFAAYILKKMHPRIFWIADFRDLPVDPYFNHVYFRKPHDKLFKSIFKKADVITTVSNGLADQLRKYNPEVIVLKNGIAKLPANTVPINNRFFTIAYTGSMYLDKKNATPIFIALKQLISEGKIQEDKIRIIYAGKDSFYWTEMANLFQLNSMLDIRGVLTSKEAMSIQQDACINVLLSISSAEQTGILTGKMIEYFEAGNPVLAIVKNQVDPELEQILQELKIGNSFSDQLSDIPHIKDFIYQEYQLWEKTGTNRKAVDLEVLKKNFSVERTMEPLYEKIGLTSSHFDSAQ